MAEKQQTVVYGFGATPDMARADCISELEKIGLSPNRGGSKPVITTQEFGEHGDYYKATARPYVPFVAQRRLN